MGASRRWPPTFAQQHSPSRRSRSRSSRVPSSPSFSNDGETPGILSPGRAENFFGAFPLTRLADSAARSRSRRLGEAYGTGNHNFRSLGSVAPDRGINSKLQRLIGARRHSKPGISSPSARVSTSRTPRRHRQQRSRPTRNPDCPEGSDGLVGTP